MLKAADHQQNLECVHLIGSLEKLKSLEILEEYCLCYFVIEVCLTALLDLRQGFEPCFSPIKCISFSVKIFVSLYCQGYKMHIFLLDHFESCISGILQSCTS